MKISIIIPVYNAEATIAQCLETIQNQTYRNLEIIVINDGSKDKSLDICSKISEKDPRVIIVNNQKNLGQSSARNKGLEIATGDYISFVDSDDYLKLELYNKVVTYINNNRDVDIVQFGLSVIRNKECVDKVLYEEEIISSKVDLIENFIYENKIYPVVWNKIYNKRIFEANRFKEGIIHEDIDLLFDLLLECNRVANIQGEYYNYVLTPDSTIGKGFYEKRMDLFKVLDSIGSKIDRDYPSLSRIFYAKACMNTFGLMALATTKNKNYIKLKDKYSEYYLKMESKKMSIEVKKKWKIITFMVIKQPKIMISIFNFISKLRKGL